MVPPLGLAALFGPPVITSKLAVASDLGRAFAVFGAFLVFVAWLVLLVNLPRQIMGSETFFFVMGIGAINIGIIRSMRKPVAD